MYRKYINIVEAANKGCPIATHDLEENVKNRQTAIDRHHYGPANPDEPGNYWKDFPKPLRREPPKLEKLAARTENELFSDPSRPTSRN